VSTPRKPVKIYETQNIEGRWKVILIALVLLPLTVALVVYYTQGPTPFTKYVFIGAGLVTAIAVVLLPLIFRG